MEIFDTLPKSTDGTSYHRLQPAKDKGNTELVIFFNVASDQGGQTYFIDDVRWSRRYTGCVKRPKRR
ncbi:MAG: hypothetical protein IPM81_16565 [Saprospirales bacterium]|nr:hypothetical protein [Saprospirales bacterium]